MHYYFSALHGVGGGGLTVIQAAWTMHSNYACEWAWLSTKCHQRSGKGAL